MKTNWTKFFMTALAAIFLCTGCGKLNDLIDDLNDLDGEWLYKVKSGKVTYRQTNWQTGGEFYTTTTAITFDDYGKRIRLESEDEGETIVYIFDETNETGYVLMTDSKTYMDVPYNSAAGIRFGYMFYGEDLNSIWRLNTGFTKKADKTVAGKTCKVYSWKDGGETVEWGGWSRITFWQQEYTDTPTSPGSTLLEATSFTETIPANSFTVPADYTKTTY